LAVRRGIGSKVERHVKHCPTGAADEFSLGRQVGLKVHSANGSLAHAESHIRLDRQKVNPVLGKFLRAPCAKKATSLILARGWIDQPYTGDAGFRELHTAIATS
jgi:hypothetical protein